jgi:hypothetical protein
VGGGGRGHTVHKKNGQEGAGQHLARTADMLGPRSSAARPKVAADYMGVAGAETLAGPPCLGAEGADSWAASRPPRRACV